MAEEEVDLTIEMIEEEGVEVVQEADLDQAHLPEEVIDIGTLVITETREDQDQDQIAEESTDLTVLIERAEMAIRKITEETLEV